MATKISYVGSFGAGVEIADLGIFALPGESVEVPDDLAGRPPSGEPGEPDYDPGEGLLAQTENWARPTTKAAKAAKERAIAPETSEEPTDNG